MHGAHFDFARTFLYQTCRVTSLLSFPCHFIGIKVSFLYERNVFLKGSAFGSDIHKYT